MHIQTKIYFLLLLLSILSVGCERRPLDGEYNQGTSVQVKISWESIPQKPEYLKILFYPVNGGPAIFRYLENINGESISVPYGEYYVLFYNWRNNGDVQSIQFADENNYTTFRAYTNPVKLTLFADTIIAQPDSLYTWSSVNKIVSSPSRNGQTLRATDTRTIAIHPSDTIIVINTQPVSQVRSYSFFIPVNTLACVNRAEASITGTSRYMYMASREVSSNSYTLSVTVSRAAGGVKCSFLTFGFIPNEEYLFTIKFSLSDGSIVQQSANLTKQIQAGVIENFTDTIQIVCPESNSGGFNNPSIGDWKNEYDDIKI